MAFGGPVQVGQEVRPENIISITKIGQPRGFSAAKDLAWLRESLAVSAGQSEILEGAIHSALAPTIANYGLDAEENTYRDLAANPEALKVAVSAQLRWRHGFAIRPDDFRLQMNPLRKGVYRSDSNLPGLCRLPAWEIDDEIVTALAALAHLNLRIEEIRAHSSITAFDDQDLAMFENRIASS